MHTFGIAEGCPIASLGEGPYGVMRARGWRCRMQRVGSEMCLATTASSRVWLSEADKVDMLQRNLLKVMPSCRKDDPMNERAQLLPLAIFSFAVGVFLYLVLKG